MSEWRDTGDICGTCGYNGKHLVIEGDGSNFCGRCRNPLE